MCSKYMRQREQQLYVAGIFTRGVSFLIQMDTSLWHSSFLPRPTWYVPCGFAIIDVPSPKVAEQLLSSQLVMIVA